MSLMYRLTAEGGVRDIDEAKREVLVSFPWETLDSYNTDFHREAFDEHLREALPIMCWSHQRTEPIGRAKHWEKTAAANELVAGFSDFDAVPRARQAFVQLRDGELTDFSFGFDRGKTAPHPEIRGAVRFTSARMAEISPVAVGSIPGATGRIRGAVGLAIRAEAEVANIRGLVEAGAISEQDGERMLDEAGIDHPRERIEVASRTDVLADALREALADGGARAVTLTIDGSGGMTIAQETVPAGVVEPAGAEADEGSPADNAADVEELAGAIDAACDAADAALDGVDTTGLPAEVQQALSLYAAASVAADELLDTLGIPDPDDTPDSGGGGRQADEPEPPAEDDAATRAAALEAEFEAAQAALTARFASTRR